jgi:DNA (cytosine-5)-methyltransferase 1
VWFAEVDKACSRLLGKRFPAVANLGDMTTLPDAVAAGEVEAPDIVVGGTPCQDFSVAGMRAGLAGQRGRLTMTYVLLVDAVDGKRGKGNECIAVWENVPGVLNHKANPFGNFLGALAGEDCALVPSGKRWPDAGVVVGPKRTVAWRCLDAQYFGLAQRRKRVFVVASARDDFDPAAVLFEREGLRRDTPPRREAGQAVAETIDARTQGGGFPGTDGACAEHVVAAFGAGNCAGPIAAAAALNANERYDFDSETFVVTQDSCPVVMNNLSPASKLGTGFDMGQLPIVCVTGDVTHTLKAEGFDASEDGTGRGQPIVPVGVDGTQPLYYQHDYAHGRVYGIDGVAPAVTTSNEAGGKNILAPTGFQSSQSGTRVNETAGTLDANYGSRRHNGVLYPAMAVRRLMPIECERLQGFPDGWTDGQADGPRYKQLGNSKAVPVVRWIGQRIEQELRYGWLRGLVDALG